MDNDVKAYSPAAIKATMDYFVKTKIVVVKAMFDSIDRKIEQRTGEPSKVGYNLYSAINRWRDKAHALAKSFGIEKFKLLEQYEPKGYRQFLEELDRQQAELDKQQEVLSDAEPTNAKILFNVLKQIGEANANIVDDTLTTTAAINELRSTMAATNAAIEGIKNRINDIAEKLGV